jgi:CheY-like chemotaxis protein
MGIASEEIGKLFRPFEQTESGKKIQTGTGLGLAISREFVRLMGGDISVSSQLGKGSIFCFEINLDERHEGAMVQSAETRHVTGLASGQTPCRVLIVDDKDDNRMLLSQMLGRIGFEVLDAINGAEAIRECARWKPHLILMDTRMPVMNGFEAITRIRSNAEGKDVKIISVTASAFDADRDKALEIGADDFLGKPFREEALLEKIKALLGLEYVYADEPVLLSHESNAGDWMKTKVEALPEALVAQLHAATVTADLDRMLALISQIERHDPVVAGKMRSLAEGFAYQKLLEITTKGA